MAVNAEPVALGQANTATTAFMPPTITFHRSLFIAHFSSLTPWLSMLALGTDDHRISLECSGQLLLVFEKPSIDHNSFWLTLGRFLQ